MAKGWRGISGQRASGRMTADIGIAADLPSAWDFAGDRLRSSGSDHSAPKGQRRQLFCEWIRQRGRSRSE